MSALRQPFTGDLALALVPPALRRARTDNAVRAAPELPTGTPDG